MLVQTREERYCMYLLTCEILKVIGHMHRKRLVARLGRKKQGDVGIE